MKIDNVYLFLLVKIVIYVIIIIAAWGGLTAYRMLYPQRLKSQVTPENHGMDFSAHKLRTSDGISISSWLIPSSKNKATVIVCHGYGTNKADVLEIARILHGGGFNVVMFDFRGHGESGGIGCNFGKTETRDVKAVIDFIKVQPKLKNRAIGILGISMGGSIAYLSGAKFKDIKAVVGDSSYVYLRRAARQYYALNSMLPLCKFSCIPLIVARIKLRTRLRNLSPITHIDKISPRPVLIIHGSGDLITPPDEVKQLYKKAKQPKQLWIEEDAQHVSVCFHSPEEYERRVIKFFNAALDTRAKNKI